MFVCLFVSVIRSYIRRRGASLSGSKLKQSEKDLKAKRNRRWSSEKEENGGRGTSDRCPQRGGVERTDAEGE